MGIKGFDNRQSYLWNNSGTDSGTDSRRTSYMQMPSQDGTGYNEGPAGGATISRKPKGPKPTMPARKKASIR